MSNTNWILKILNFFNFKPPGNANLSCLFSLCNIQLHFRTQMKSIPASKYQYILSTAGHFEAHFLLRQYKYAR